MTGLAGKQNICGEEGKIYQNLSEICVFPQTSGFGALESFCLAGWKGPEAKLPNPAHAVGFTQISQEQPLITSGFFFLDPD